MPAARHRLATLGFALRPDATLPALTMRVGAPAAPPPRVTRSEGYGLLVDRRGIALRGADADGFYWGLATLAQLGAGDAARAGFQTAVIRDWPAFAFRCHHDDISRGQVSTVAGFRRIVRLLSNFKVRCYTPYIEDMLALPSCPDIGVGRGRLEADEVRALLAEARLWNVTVFPTFSLIGHQENLLALPRYRRYAREVFQRPSSFDPAKPELRVFLRRVIADVCALFPDAPFFHAGFDETQGVPEDDLIAHANWCAAEIARHGKRMLMWIDMFKNHFGIERLQALSPAIVPVEWCYDDPLPAAERYRAARIAPLGLAGYNNWSRFLPDFREGKRNIARWTKAARRMGSAGFGASQWGDDGYENSRDLCWNLFACNAEAAWRGRAPAADFERRFQTVFYGRSLPPLRRLIEHEQTRRRIPPPAGRRLFRTPFAGLVRLTQTHPGLAARAAADERLATRMLRLTASAQRMARREAEQLDAFKVALERERLVSRRLLLAARLAREGAKLTEASRRAAREHLREHARVRALYRRDWLRRNKRPNIELSLDVFDTVAASLRAWLRPPRQVPRGYACLALEGRNLQADDAVAGVPRRDALIGGVPFRFPEGPRTHIRLTAGDRVTLAMPPMAVKDLHLIYGGINLPADARARRPLLTVRLRRQGRVVFAERLRAIRHVCDWWAPRGEHIWAGGGLRYADPRRVAFALAPGDHHGLLHLRGFRPRGVTADAVELEMAADAGKTAVALFALTAEEGKINENRQDPR
jgi:hypothetical protein